MAGLSANLVAFSMRGGFKVLGLNHAGGRPLAFWLPQAVLTYSACGLIAGAISALFWFRLRSRDDPRVPYTSQNGSASIVLKPTTTRGSCETLIDELRSSMREAFIDGSDPGLCVSQSVPDEVKASALTKSL